MLLLVCCWLSKEASQLLLQSSMLASSASTYEGLALRVLGGAGKLLVTVAIFWQLLGTTVAFFVVIGDLVPRILASLGLLALGPALSSSRVLIMTLTGCGVVFPICLSRDIQGLANLSMASLLFYAGFCASIIALALPNMLQTPWLHTLPMVDTSGIFSSVPILSIAFACQTSIFMIYNALPDANTDRMSLVVSSALDVCCALYFVVGFFGSICFQQTTSGNILNDLGPGLLTSILQLGFAASILASFPLVVYPCRASLHTLLFSQAEELPSALGLPRVQYIPQNQFVGLTAGILLLALGIAIVLPAVQTALALVGSTVGLLISYIIPAGIFLQVSSPGHKKRRMAKLLLLAGLFFSVCGTANVLFASPDPHATHSHAPAPGPMLQDQLAPPTTTPLLPDAVSPALPASTTPPPLIDILEQHNAPPRTISSDDTDVHIPGLLDLPKPVSQDPPALSGGPDLVVADAPHEQQDGQDAAVHHHEPEANNPVPDEGQPVPDEEQPERDPAQQAPEELDAAAHLLEDDAVVGGDGHEGLGGAAAGQADQPDHGPDGAPAVVDKDTTKPGGLNVLELEDELAELKRRLSEIDAKDRELAERDRKIVDDKLQARDSELGAVRAQLRQRANATQALLSQVRTQAAEAAAAGKEDAAAGADAAGLASHTHHRHAATTKNPGAADTDKAATATTVTPAATAGRLKRKKSMAFAGGKDSSKDIAQRGADGDAEPDAQAAANNAAKELSALDLERSLLRAQQQSANADREAAQAQAAALEARLKVLDERKRILDKLAKTADADAEDGHAGQGAGEGGRADAAVAGSKTKRRAAGAGAGDSPGAHRRPSDDETAGKHAAADHPPRKPADRHTP